MTLTTSRVGIKTTTPQGDLDVGGMQMNSLPLSSGGTFNLHFVAAASGYQKFFQVFSAYNNGYFRFMAPSDNTKRADMSVDTTIGFGITAFDDTAVLGLPMVFGSKDFLIRTRGDGDPNSATYNRLYVSSAGRVGLGTTTPDGVLHTRDGVGGNLVGSLTGVGSSAMMMLSSGVYHHSRVEMLLWDGATSYYLSFILSSALPSLEYTFGSCRLTFYLSGSGMYVYRSFGSLTFNLTYNVICI
jgi:hypothetical protein